MSSSENRMARLTREEKEDKFTVPLAQFKPIVGHEETLKVVLQVGEEECEVESVVDEAREKEIQELLLDLEEALGQYNTVMQTEESVYRPYWQNFIRKTIRLLEEITVQVSLLQILPYSIISPDDELTTVQLKFTLLPVLLGMLFTKLSVSNRIETNKTALAYFDDFLSRCHRYGIFTLSNNNEKDDIVSDGEEMMMTRTAVMTYIYKSVEEFQQKFLVIKERTERSRESAAIELLLQLYRNEKDIQDNNKLKTEYIQQLIKSLAYRAVNEIENIKTEFSLIKYLTKHGKEDSFDRKILHKTLDKDTLLPVSYDPVLLDNSEGSSSSNSLDEMNM